MNYLFKSLCLLLLITVSTCSIQKSVSSFTEFRPLRGDSPVSGLYIGIKTDTVQKAGPKGLQLSVQLTNKSPGKLIVSNINEILTPALLNESGSNVLYPFIPSSLIHSTTQYLSPSYKVVGIRINGREIKPEKETTIPENGYCEVKIAIVNMLPPGAEKPYYPDKLVPLAPGKYILIGSLSIIQGVVGSVYNMKMVMIQYGHKGPL